MLLMRTRLLQSPMTVALARRPFMSSGLRWMTTEDANKPNEGATPETKADGNAELQAKLDAAEKQVKEFKVCILI